MTRVLLNILGAAIFPALCSGAWMVFYRLTSRRRFRFLEGWIGGAVFPLVVDVIAGQWPWVAGDGASLVIAVILWWWNRRKRNRAPRSLGAKSKALRDALVRRMRRAAKPRPVLRPAPGGVR